MRTSLIAFLALALLVCTGCQQVCCVRDNVASGARSVAGSVESSWNCAKRTVCSGVDRLDSELDSIPDCGAPCEQTEVYANHCGGDNAIGRTGTGAFAIPPTP